MPRGGVRGPHKRKPLSERFYPKVGRVDDESCWGWEGATAGKGYGVIGIGGALEKRQIGAHVASYMIHVGPVPAGMCVCHECDNPLCVNPVHLFLGTYSDNLQDMVRKRRRVWVGVPGANNPNAKLTDGDVAMIRSRFAAGGITRAALAVEYGVSGTHIGRLIVGANRAQR